MDSHFRHFLESLFKSYANILIKFAVFSFTYLFCISTLIANPQGANIVSGNVTIQQVDTNQVQINQTSQKAIINWNSFNINTNEHTHFQQPHGGVVLNRIDPNAGVSQIYGKLTATGQVILSNSAGIYFGPSAYVNVGGLIATTANISNENFLNGNYHFDLIIPSGSVVNEGQIIIAAHGLAALVAPTVTNNGLIEANMGHVILASGSAFTINFSPDGLISFSLENSPLAGSITNKGKIVANGGRVLISVKTAQVTLDNVINMDGIVVANSVGNRNGEIILMSNNGTTTVTGQLNASGKNQDEHGGNIEISGKQILLTDHALLDASGYNGAGIIHVGGNAQGQGPLLNADYVYAGPQVRIIAQTIANGDGGNIVVWSNLGTYFYGNICA